MIPASIKIGPFTMGDWMKPIVVAEAGINHNGDVKTARRMVKAAKEAGADAFKIQAFAAEDFCSPSATYHGERQIDLFRRYELAPQEIMTIAVQCEDVGIPFFGTPDCEAHARLLEDLGAFAIKIGSDDLTNTPLIEFVAGLALPVILSTGMACEREIGEAMDILSGRPKALLHCVSEYPTPIAHAHLGRMTQLRAQFGHRRTPIGYSDHTAGITSAALSVAFGACLIEKHFTLDKRMKGPDHAFSADPKEMRDLARAVHEAHSAIGDFGIEPGQSDKAMRATARRSIRAANDLPAGITLTEGHLVFLRPGDGLPPSKRAYVLGRRLARHIDKGKPITMDDFT